MGPSPLPPDVIRRARQGDVVAFRQVAEAYERLLFRIAYRMTFDAEDARDLCQEILLRVHRNFGQFDPDRPFEPWLVRVATNVCLNWRKRPRRVEAIGGTEELDRCAPPPEPSDGGPGDAEQLRRALEALPAEYRLVLALRYEQGHDYGRIAELAGVPLGTVKTWIFRAKGMLKESMDGSNRPLR